MKKNGSNGNGSRPPTLADLVAAVTKLTRDERLSAYIVADMINSRQVRLEGEFQDRRVIVS